MESLLNPRKHCKIYEHPNAKKDIIFLHGFTSDKDAQSPIIDLWKDDPEFNVIACDARGHGSRKKVGEREDWEGSLEDLDQLINTRKHDTILIGHSMGGTLALSLGSRNAHVKQVFAVGAVNGLSMFKNPEKLDWYLRRYRLEMVEKHRLHFVPSLPENYNTCKKQNRNKFYLIHATDDTIVPFDQFEKNKSELCLPDENTLVMKDIPMYAHQLSFYSSDAINFINEHIKHPSPTISDHAQRKIESQGYQLPNNPFADNHTNIWLAAGLMLLFTGLFFGIGMAYNWITVGSMLLFFIVLQLSYQVVGMYVQSKYNDGHETCDTHFIDFWSPGHFLLHVTLTLLFYYLIDGLLDGLIVLILAIIISISIALLWEYVEFRLFLNSHNNYWCESAKNHISDIVFGTLGTFTAVVLLTIFV